MKFSPAAVILGLATSGAALAQSVVGKAVVDGRTVVLFDDGTWKHEDSTSTDGTSGCDVITPTVEFCVGALGWGRTDPPNAEINAAYRIDSRHYAQYLIEELGTEDGFTSEFMRQVVLDNAEGATGNLPEVIDVQPATLGTFTGETVIYRLDFNGLSAVYANSIFVGPKKTMQVMTYAVGDEYTPQHQAHQAALLANTKVAE